MSPRIRRNPILAVAAAATGVAAAAAGAIAADRGRHRAGVAALETPGPLGIQADEEHVVITDDGVALHVEIDRPRPVDAADAAAGTTRDDRPAALPTVVLTHGYCLSLRCWTYQRRAFRDAGYTVISWDQRGHGRSADGGEDSYVIDRLGIDLHTVIEQLAPDDDLVLIGHSMGGMTILALCEQYPDLLRDRVTGAAFISTSPGGLTLANGGRVATVARLLLSRLGPVVLAPLSTRPDLFSTIRRVGRDLEDFIVEQNCFASPVPRSIVRYTADMLLGTRLEVINGYLRTFDGYDKRPVLTSFEHTMVLVFNGMQDTLTPPAHSELIVEALPGAEHILVNNAGHVIMLEHPELLNSHLIALIDQSVRAKAEYIDLSRRPSVRRVVTDVARPRRVRSIEKEAEALERATRRSARRSADRARPGTSRAKRQQRGA